MSNTPRTDAETHGDEMPTAPWVSAELARTLERELAGAKAERDALKRELAGAVAQLRTAEHERDVALVNEREMATALRKQHDNYNHLTGKIDSWKECINAATNRERAALAERDGADAACQKLKDTCEVLTQEIARLTEDRDNWKAKHWKAHDDFHRQFLEMENIRQQVASATTALRNCALAASAGNIEQIAWIVESSLTNVNPK